MRAKETKNIRKREEKWFEGWARKNGMFPVCKVDDKDGFILIADSGRAIVEVRGANHRAYYRTGMAFYHDGDMIASSHDYDALDFPLQTERAAQEQRVNEALAHARAYLRKLKQAGFYDAGAKGRFSNEPA